MISQYQNIKNETSTGRPHRSNLGQGVNRLEMSFNGKYYTNVKFTIIGENKDHEQINDFLRISTNYMFTQMSAKKGIKLFNECTVVDNVKVYTPLEDMNVVGPDNPDVITPEQNKNNLEL